MDVSRLQELRENLERSLQEDHLADRAIYLFGHCEATLALADELARHQIFPKAILDNSSQKQGILYREIPVKNVESILAASSWDAIVLICSRFYEQMKAQLRGIGFKGKIQKLVDYNSYAEYSLSEKTITSKLRRCERGKEVLRGLERKYPAAFFIFCPFPALGDVYDCMAYLPHWKKKHGIPKTVICVSAKPCADVVSIFCEEAALLGQGDLDAAVQAVFQTQYENAFVAHQDRPYTVNLHHALYVRKIPLEMIYKVGVFGLNASETAVSPAAWKVYSDLDRFKRGRTAVLSPYAKSVPSLPEKLWGEIVTYLKDEDYQVLTNVGNGERPLCGTEPVSPLLAEMKSLVEYAGLFIGIRSGLCDVIRTAQCRKIALYPDYYYSDTRWKAIDMYAIAGFENLVVEGGETWEQVRAKIGAADFVCPPISSAPP